MFIIELRSCARLRAPANGTLQGTDTSHGAKANFACLTGFDLFGLSTLTCNNGAWSATVPSCKGNYLDACPFNFKLISDRDFM